MFISDSNLDCPPAATNRCTGRPGMDMSSASDALHTFDAIAVSRSMNARVSIHYKSGVNNVEQESRVG